MTTRILLSPAFGFICDDEDVPAILRKSWRKQNERIVEYGDCRVALHRWLIKPDPPNQVWHKNNDRFDFRRDNLASAAYRNCVPELIAASKVRGYYPTHSGQWLVKLVLMGVELPSEIFEHEADAMNRVAELRRPYVEKARLPPPVDPATLPTVKARNYRDTPLRVG